MAFESILFDVRDGIARLTLNRPDKLNSFNLQMHAEVRGALESIGTEHKARVLVLTGSGRGFCAGQDLADRAVAPDAAPVDLGESVEMRYGPLVRKIRSLPIPVVCAVNGVAAGAGANLALACDIVVATRSASFIEPFCRLGLVPDTGGTYFLPRLVGTARAMGLALTRREADRGGGGIVGPDLEVRRRRRVRAGGRRAGRVVRVGADQGLRADQARDLRERRQYARAAARPRARLHARARVQPRLSRRRERVHSQAPACASPANERGGEAKPSQARRARRRPIEARPTLRRFNLRHRYKETEEAKRRQTRARVVARLSEADTSMLHMALLVPEHAGKARVHLGHRDRRAPDAARAGWSACTSSIRRR